MMELGLPRPPPPRAMLRDHLSQARSCQCSWAFSLVLCSTIVVIRSGAAPRKLCVWGGKELAERRQGEESHFTVRGPGAGDALHRGSGVSGHHRHSPPLISSLVKRANKDLLITLVYGKD